MDFDIIKYVKGAVNDFWLLIDSQKHTTAYLGSVRNSRKQCCSRIEQKQINLSVRFQAFPLSSGLENFSNINMGPFVWS